MLTFRQAEDDADSALGDVSVSGRGGMDEGS